IDPVAPQPDIDIATVVSFDFKPIDELLSGTAGSSARIHTVQTVQHRNPCGKQLLGAPVESACRAFETRTLPACRFACFRIQLAPQSGGKCEHGFCDPA